MVNEEDPDLREFGVSRKDNHYTILDNTQIWRFQVLEFPVSAITIPISIVFAIVIYRMIFVGDDENRLRREVEEEAQQEANQQQMDAEELTPRQIERQRIEAEIAVEKSKQAAAKREAERRRKEIQKARRASLRVSPLKGPATAVTVMARLVRLPIVRYKQHRLQIKKAKQAAAERQRLEAEKAAQVAAQQEAERQRLEADRIKQATEQEAERQRLEAERAKQAAAQREAERQRMEDERAKLVAMMVQQQKREEYWESLDGIQFEQELGELFRARGYSVKSTPTSGDQGVDLILAKNGKLRSFNARPTKVLSGHR